MNQISELPGEDYAGLDFDYSKWAANTEVTLCRVPWDNTYRDILSPQALENIDAYIDSRPGVDILEYKNVVNVRMGEPISIPKPYNAAARFNYLRATAPAKPVPGDDIPMTYYYFITGFVEDSSNSTKVLLQLDVWATYGLSVEIYNAFVERGHIGIANERQFDNYGRDYLTVPEGLDLGSSYITRTWADRQLFSLTNCAVLVCSNVDLEQPWTDDNGRPDKRTSPGGSFMRMPSGASFYVFRDIAGFNLFMKAVSPYPYIAQGIMSVTLIPEFDAHFPGFRFNEAPSVTYAPANKPTKVTETIFSQWRDYVRQSLPEKYRHLRKFLTSPYCYAELTASNGSPLTLKPELWNTDTVTLDRMVAFVPPQQRMVVMPNDYGGVDGAHEYATDYLDTALVISNFPTLPMVNDAGTMYLAQNHNAIAQGSASAEWALDKSNRANMQSYDMSTLGINTSTDYMNQGNANARAGQSLNERYAVSEAVVGGIQNIGQSAIGGAVAGPGGALAGAAMGTVSSGIGGLNTVMSISKSQEALAQSIANNQAVNDIGTRSATQMRDSTYALSSYVANGDYQQIIQGQLAAQRDAKVSPNSVIGSYGGEGFNIINDVPTLIFRAKTIDNAAIRRIGDYWLRFGYAVGMYADIPESLMVMDKFTYWKLSETYINTAPMPEVFKHAIRGIFEKGVTVWNAPGDIGKFNNNKALTGITL